MVTEQAAGSCFSLQCTKHQRRFYLLQSFAEYGACTLKQAAAARWTVLSRYIGSSSTTSRSEKQTR